jgi:hypothetical protein
MKRKNDYPMGSVSHATMRPEDLIPTFTSELTWRRSHGTLQRKQRAELRAIESRMEADGYYDSEDAQFDLEWLFDALDAYSAPYFYFGAHPGDGSDYGYWLSEMWDEDFVSLTDLESGDENLKVSDPAEVPKNFYGEVAVVNDHGNVTLYHRSRNNRIREIWSVV